MNTKSIPNFSRDAFLFIRGKSTEASKEEKENKKRKNVTNRNFKNL